MNNGGASPSGLRVPVSSASPSGSNNTTTGRPALWTPSSQRKVSRLYLFTTLPLEKIMAVVHAKSPDTAPGIESANKKLNALLNKQPRWLHPRSEEDMGRRLDELSLSPTRSNSSWTSFVSRPHAASDPVPYLHPNPTPSLTRNSGTSPTLEVPPFNQFPPPQHQQQQQNIPNRAAAPPRQTRPSAQQPDNGVFQRFLQRTGTIMSQSTDCTTGSLHRILDGFSDSYVKSVKKLVKRYTAPIGHRAESLSPISDEEPSEGSTWLNDPCSPPKLSNGPYYLPGDFLCLDELVRQQPHCFQQTEQHMKRSCLCHPTQDIQEPAWVTANGLAAEVDRLLQYSLHNLDIDMRDRFGNTLLHLMAARGMVDYLFPALLSDQCVHIVNVRNTAGQTILHVLHRDWFRNEQLLMHLLSILKHKNFDFGARDHYGRAFSHILLSRDVSYNLRNHFLETYDHPDITKRDAFDVSPTPATQPEPTMGISRADTQAMDLDPPQHHCDVEPFHYVALTREARLLEIVREASIHSTIEDSEGRNGLHCLAAATLSQSSVLQKYNLDDAGEPTDQKRRKDKTPKDLDSCTKQMKVRSDNLAVLLSAGVDPNHYDTHGNTPLMAFAAQLPEDDDYKIGPQILQQLVEAGAEVNARNRAGETALHIAVRCGRKLAARQLVDLGASVHARDAAGRSVLEVADAKMKSLSSQDAEEYAHLEACRAWLSGQKGMAVQDPSVLQEWGV